MDGDRPADDGGIADGAPAVDGTPAADGTPPAVDGEVVTDAAVAPDGMVVLDATPADDAALMDAEIEPLPEDAAPPCEPQIEVCNGVDDDCDGRTDEWTVRGLPMLSNQIAPQGFIGARYAVSGDTLLVLWTNLVEGSLRQTGVNLFGRALNLRDGGLSAVRQYTDFPWGGEVGLNGGIDVIADGEGGFVVVRSERMGGLARPAYDALSLLRIDRTGVAQQPFFSPETRTAANSMRLMGRGEAISIAYRTGRSDLKMMWVEGGQYNITTLRERDVTAFDVIQPIPDEVPLVLAAYSSINASDDLRDGLYLAELAQGELINEPILHRPGLVTEPDLFRVGELLGLTWIERRRGSHTTYFDLLEFPGLQSVFGEPMAIHREANLVTGAPKGTLLPMRRGAAPTLLVHVLAAQDVGLDGEPAGPQQILRIILRAGADLREWEVMDTRTVLPSESNIIEHTLGAGADRIVSFSVDNGYGGAMCNVLCGMAVAQECEAVPNDAEALDCRQSCESEALFLPGLLSCLGRVDCGAPDAQEMGRMCEAAGQAAALEPPPFESAGLYVNVAEVCPPM